MAWGKKPWQGSSKLSPSDKRAKIGHRWGSEYISISSQYQSRRETKNTLKGFLILVSFMVGTIAFIHWIARFLS